MSLESDGLETCGLEKDYRSLEATSYISGGLRAILGHMKDGRPFKTTLSAKGHIL